MSIVYEVNLRVDADIAVAYRAWLRGHIGELLQLPGFIDARVLDVVDPPPREGSVGLCVQYTLRDRAALDAYLGIHAARMREAGEARYGGRFQAQRRILEFADAG